MNKKNKISILLVAISLSAGLMFWTVPASAYLASEYRSQADLAIGSMVALDDDGELIPASQEMENYVGVVTARSDGALEVATSGAVALLVSSADGEIADGTQVGLSNINGVATKSSDVRESIGVVTEAPTDWREHSTEASDNDAISVGTATVKLVEKRSTGTAESNSYMGALQRVASGIAGREIDTWRAVAALLIALGGVVIALALLMSSSRSSFLSLGRNPMAGGAIMKGLWKVAAVAVAILVISLLIAYAIVRSG